MRALSFALLLVISPAASAQLALLNVTAQCGAPFWVQVNMQCPPPGGGATPLTCNGGFVAAFQATPGPASTPGLVYVQSSNQTQTFGPFTFFRAGSASIQLIATDWSLFVGQVNVDVRGTCPFWTHWWYWMW